MKQETRDKIGDGVLIAAGISIIAVIVYGSLFAC